MPSKPTFEDACFVLAASLHAMKESFNKSLGEDEAKMKMAFVTIHAYTALLRAFQAIMDNGDLPSNEERRRHRLREIYRDTLVKCATEIERGLQKPAEN